MKQLETKSFAERRAALEASTRAIRQAGERELALLQKQTAAVNARTADEVAKAERLAAEHDERLALAITAEFQASIAAHVAAWREEPSRKLAVAMADVFQRFDQRAERELGANLWDGALAWAFASELMKAQPNAASLFGSNDWGSSRVIELLGAVRRAISTGPAQVATTMTALEAELQSVAACATGEPTDELVRRFAVKKTCATAGDATTKLGAFDEREEARRREAFARTYVPPERLDRRAPGVLRL